MPTHRSARPATRSAHEAPRCTPEPLRAPRAVPATRSTRPNDDSGASDGAPMTEGRAARSRSHPGMGPRSEERGMRAIRQGPAPTSPPEAPARRPARPPAPPARRHHRVRCPRPHPRPGRPSPGPDPAELHPGPHPARLRGGGLLQLEPARGPGPDRVVVPAGGAGLRPGDSGGPASQLHRARHQPDALRLLPGDHRLRAVDRRGPGPASSTGWPCCRCWRC